MGKAAAFFDIDRTLLVGTSLESCFLRSAWRRKLLSPLALARNLPAGLRALGLAGKARGFPIPAGLPWRTRLRYAFFSGNKAYLAGLSLETCHRLAQAALEEEVLPRLSPRAIGRIREHRASGCWIVLLSGTLDFLAQPLQAYLQADRLLAARPEIEGGRLTGRLAEPHPYGARKQSLLLEIATEEGIDLADSFAYADHHTDVPFLEAVGHPVAVNPDRKLYRIARERGWQIEWFGRERA
ncbi:MAG: HAD family hydrolase [Chloroflexia bacterium]